MLNRFVQLYIKIRVTFQDIRSFDSSRKERERERGGMVLFNIEITLRMLKFKLFSF